MWTTETFFSGDDMRVRLANDKFSVVLGSKEYLDLVAALRLRLSEITEADYHREVCRTWGAQPIEVLQVHRTPGLPVEYRVSRDEGEDMLADSQKLKEF